MNATYRLHPAHFFLSIGFMTLFGIAMLPCASIFFLEDPKKNGFNGEYSVLLVGGLGIALCGFMLVMSLYMLIASRVGFVRIDGVSIAIRSVFQNQRIEVSQITKLKWRCRPVGGSFVILADDRKAWIDLHDFPSKARLEVIRFLNSKLPMERQIGWPLFCHKIALPLRDDLEPTMVERPDMQLITRSRYDRMLVWAIPLSVFFGLACWILLNAPQFFVTPVIVLGAWALLRYHVPIHGRYVPKPASSRRWQTGKALAISHLFIGAMMIAAVMIDRVETYVILIVCAMLIMFFSAYRADQFKRAEDERDAVSAPGRWSVGEASSV